MAALSADQMPYGSEGVDQKQPRACVAHDLADFLAAFGFITMDAAGAAKGLLLPERTTFEPGFGILQQVGTSRTELASAVPRMPVAPAGNADQLLDGLLLPRNARALSHAVTAGTCRKTDSIGSPLQMRQGSACYNAGKSSRNGLRRRFRGRAGAGVQPGYQGRSPTDRGARLVPARRPLQGRARTGCRSKLPGPGSACSSEKLG